MKKVLSVLIFAAALFGVPNAYADEDGAKTREVILAFFDAFNQHDVDAMIALYHPEAKVVTPEKPEPRFGAHFMRENYTNLFNDLPDVHDTVTRLVVDGEEAAVEFTASFSIPDGEGGMVEAGLNIASFLKVVDGLIVEDITYYDRMSGSEKE